MFFVGLGWLPLLEPDEGRNAEVAREMLVSGDWVTPHFNSLTYLDKPAVFFWLVAGSFRLWGVSEWAARFPSALAALGTMLLTWFLARRMFGDDVGFRAAIILATSPLVIILSHLVIFDMTLAFLVTASMASFWLEDASGFQRPWLDVFLFAAMGLAAITKGPVGFLLPLLSILVYQAIRRRFHERKRLRWGLGLGVFLAAALPWFIAVSARNPDFPRYALWQESLQRFTSGQARRAGGFLYYVPVFLAGFFPWSLFLLFAGWNRLKRWREIKQEAQTPVTFLLTWAGVIFVFFSISSSKLPAYFLPAIVPLSILMAKVWAEVGRDQGNRSPDWLTAGFAGLMGVGLITAAAPQVLRFAAVEIAATEKVDPAVVRSIQPSLFYSGLIVLALGFLGRNLAARGSGISTAAKTFALVALAMPILMVRGRGALTTYAATSSGRHIAETILASPENELPLYGYYCFRPSLVFYLKRPVGLVTADASEMTSNYISSRLPELRRTTLLMNPWTSLREAERGADSGPPLPGYRLLIDPTDLRARARYSPQPFLVMVRNRDASKLAQTVERVEPLWSEWEFSVWKIPAGNPERGVERPR